MSGKEKIRHRSESGLAVSQALAVVCVLVFEDVVHAGGNCGDFFVGEYVFIDLDFFFFVAHLDWLSFYYVTRRAPSFHSRR